MHIYQKAILDKLRRGSEMRYSELQPPEVESSHFKYHLNQLIKDGFVEQKGRGIYLLTVKGKSLVDRLSTSSVNPILVPKLITYVLLKDETNFYLQRKQKEPYAGLINMIGGKVHVGESTIEAARREVLEKTTYKPKNLTLLSIAEIRISQNSNLLSHAIAYVYGAMIGEDAKKLQDCIKIPQEATADYKDLAPDFIRIITEINNSETLCVLNMAIDFVQ